MGSKNRINLGIIASFIIHFHRNFYKKNKIYMSKRVLLKIKEKHNDVAIYSENKSFQYLMNNTIASCDYSKCQDTINFISYVDNYFILYALKKENNHTSCTTIYRLKPRALKQHYKQESFKIIKKEYEEIIKDYLAS